MGESKVPSVREARPEDAPAVRRIATIDYHRTYADTLDADVIERILAQAFGATLPSLIESCAPAEDACFLVAEADEVVGFAFYGPGDEGPELHWLYTDPERLHMGIGTHLLDELDRRLQPGTTFVAYVVGGNERALAFYRARGFRDAGRVDVQEHYGAHPHRSGLEDVRLRYTLPRETEN